MGEWSWHRQLLCSILSFFKFSGPNVPLLILAILFLVVAVAYSAVGFGGGSTYNALLILSGMDYRLVPAIALSCNILVVSGGVYHYWRAGHLSARQLLPFIVISVPMAWLGGSLEVSELVFVGLLGFFSTGISRYLVVEGQ